MSRRRNVDRVTESVCTWARCKNPTRDDAFVCDPCLDELSTGLRDLRPYGELKDAAVWSIVCPWPRPLVERPGLWDDLLTTVAGEQGIDYRTIGTGSPSDQTGIVLSERAAEIALEVRRSLRALVLVSQATRLEHNAPSEWSPTSTAVVPAMTEWLSWRVDAIAWHYDAAQAAQRVRDAVDDARWVIDRPEAREQLGDCMVPGCDGWLSATPGASYARCNRDDHVTAAQPIRDKKLAELTDRLCTAAEIARLSTYLGLRQDRDAVRKRVNQWAARDRIAARSPAPGTTDPRFRFGDVYPLLTAAEPTTSSTDSKGA